ncbi:tRNA preQ1(34) S-adenosylmethionine ribosyltransferase-isomerase QueA [Treponema pedis]|uniref:tRNA preQ1(34) S-adenosylmethionine ribosyltransferase-isomerase QueA n=1 Tax=Treponema pedis TaxID=409322 RepID=UPI0003F7D259|nr:tRNA preQ1(34) S-adenosylmethionine ribosyltransferase-isomerase QueA [Treponema pedis]
MLTKEFNFELPQELIAQTPSKIRGNDKLLILNKKTGNLEDKVFCELPDILPKDALMVFNNSKVRRARIYAESSSGAQTEFLLINPIPEFGGFVWQVMVKKAKRQKAGKIFVFRDGTKAEIIETEKELGNEFRCLKFDKIIDDDWLDLNGHIPLPPYIRRNDTEEDAERYQTVYAKAYGSIAAPTAGLHFTEEVLNRIKNLGIDIEYVTLHVGLGTFLPVRSENVEEHKMHTEYFSISETAASNISKAKKDGRPIIAVGTTSVRTLESAWNEKTLSLKTGNQSTDIFIYPPYKFKVVDKLFTNFHTPESSLVMLVSALAGKENIFNAYRHAIERRYRFFSYGDAMLII